MNKRPRKQWGLGARLLAAIVAVLLVAAGTAWAVASVIGPMIFHDHMLMAEPADSEVVAHARQAFTAAWTLSLSLALLVALLTSVLVSIFLTRRITMALERLRQAAAKVASGDYNVHVPAVRMGAQFDDLAGAFNTMATDLGGIEQTRTRMLGDLAHELRTPVATLDGYLEGIVDGVVPADEPTIVMLREQVARLARLAQDMALVTAASEGRLEMRWQLVRVGDLLEDAAAQASVKCTSKDIDLAIVATRSERQAVITADPDRLGQVLTNLLDNAVRHTPKGGQVQLGADRIGSRLRLWVQDNGSGIAAEHLPHLFERFYRADAARDRAHGGSGIGLAISHSIAQAHAGSVRADSAGLGHGAVFTIELPLSRQHSQA
ncbi:ATP-binding protein [Pseudactinotalea sp. Z1732]|uniref:HAMP domain-containing sensor histidine kinase n=1 Tax=Micrococcales TaxID=85006 RepID=UPI003C7ABBD7